MSKKFIVRLYSEPDDRSAWINDWENSTIRDPFAHPTYVSLFCNKNDMACCAVYKDENGEIHFPFILRQIGESGYFDIASPYGYGGAYILAGVKDAETLERFWFYFNIWAYEKKVISEMIRCHLLAKCGNTIGNKVEVNENVICDLSISTDEEWMGFEHKVRKNVNKARRNNVYVKIDAAGKTLDDFLGIYYSTMSRRNAGESYYFKKEFFTRIINEMRGSYLFVNSYLNERLVSTELALVSKIALYSYLGGTDESAFSVCPNDLLKYELMQWGRENKIAHYVMGGGYSLGDGIFKYKRSFAPYGVVPFYISQRILNEGVYSEMVENKIRQEAQGGSPVVAKNFFPRYRS